MRASNLRFFLFSQREKKTNGQTQYNRRSVQVSLLPSTSLPFHLFIMSLFVCFVVRTFVVLKVEWEGKA